MDSTGSSTAFGPQLRRWRHSRGVTQETLALRAGVSPRHLSFVENGRSRPSREVVIALAEALDVPLRERNNWLAAAGFAAAYRASGLDDEELAFVRRALDHVLAQQEPFGAVVVDGCCNIVRMNGGAQRLFAHVRPTTPAGLAAAGNLLLGVVHPDALRPYIVNWEEVASHVVARAHREAIARPNDESRTRLLAAVLPHVPSAWRTPAPTQTAAPFVTVHLRAPTLEVRLFTMLSSIGTPLDVTASELQVESYFPADADSEQKLRALAT
ncbi:MAG: helix-turn-helix transcriptional regulator [Deltaproteobacteria bacterium]|nr:helix-turn-helix transcriptional regulator [Deltaproteobacteria bacterium]MDQ3298687.1 helix-turn-helix domain-containing protein [Myxococcota bacterium]